LYVFVEIIDYYRTGRLTPFHIISYHSHCIQIIHFFINDAGFLGIFSLFAHKNHLEIKRDLELCRIAQHYFIKFIY